VALAALAFATQAWAEDTLRLALPNNSDTQTTLDLKATEDDLDAELHDIARGGRGGGGRGGVGRGGRGGFGRGGIGRGGVRGGFRGRGFGFGGRGFGFRGRGFGFRGRGFGFGGWGSGFGGWGYGGYGGYYGGYYPYYSDYYYAPPVYGVYSAYPCSGTIVSSSTTLSTPLPPVVGTPVPSGGQPGIPAPAPKPAPGTYPYDGGPKAPIPMPRVDETKVPARPRGPALADEVFVSLEQQSKWNYPAYGEKPTRGTGSSPLRSTVITGKSR
jgi:hypothetical protein